MRTLFQHYCASLLGLHGCFVLYFSIFFPEDFKASCSTELQGMTEDGSHFYVDQFQSSMKSKVKSSFMMSGFYFSLIH